MAVEYATKYAGKVDERFALASVTDRAVNQDYDWDGVSTVKVYSVPTVALGDYTVSGSNRYGNPEELGNQTQEMLLSQDKAFTFTIDRKSLDDTQGAMEAGRALRREIDEVVIPTVDAYRLSKMVAGGGAGAVSQTASTSNAYALFLSGQTALMNAKVPLNGRLCYCTPAFYAFLKQDDSFIKAGDVAQNMLVTGSVGMVDGVNIIPVPTSYLPSGINFVITHPVAMVGPVKLESYRTHIDPPGLNGTLVEGRIRYDAFVLASKSGAIYVCDSGAGNPTGITISTTSASVGSAGATLQLKAAPAPAYLPVTWASSATSKATVSSTGLVTAVSTGSANITATVGTYTATCVVTVS